MQEYLESQWFDERVLNLIYEIEQLRYLWDPRYKDKKNKNKKNDGIKSLTEKFGVTVEEIKKSILLYCNLIEPADKNFQIFRRVPLLNNLANH